MVPTGVHIGENIFSPKANLVTVRDMYRDHRSILVYPYSSTIGYTYTYRIVGDGRRGVEDVVATGDGRPQRVVVEQVGLAQRQPLRRAGERPQVRVLQAQNFFCL